MEIRINGKRAGANWADELMSGITEQIGRKVADHVLESVPEGTNVKIVVTDEQGKELEGKIAEHLKHGIDERLSENH